MPCFIRAESGSVRFVSPHVPNAEPVAALPKGRDCARCGGLSRVEAAHTIGCGEDVTWKNQPERVRVTFTVLPQNVPVTVTVCVAGSKDEVRSTSHVPDAPVRAHLKLPLCVAVCRPESAPLTMLIFPSNAMFGLPLIVSTPRLVSNAQSVSVLVATVSSDKLCVVRSPVPVVRPAMTTCPPFGHCFVMVN